MILYSYIKILATITIVFIHYSSSFPSSISRHVIAYKHSHRAIMFNSYINRIIPNTLNKYNHVSMKSKERFLNYNDEHSSSSSIKPSRFDHLQDKVISIISEQASAQAISSNLSSSYYHVYGKIRNQSVQFSCHQYNISYGRYARLVRFYGCDYDVFNFIIIPSIPKHQPVLGIDLVFIKNKAIFAIDFQPTHNISVSSSFYDSIDPIYHKYADMLPEMMSVPALYRDYFSPRALFLRADARDLHIRSIVDDAVIEYLHVYLDGIAKDHHHHYPIYHDVNHVYEEALRKYLSFRVLHDPAKNILYAAFGKAWTDRALVEAIFPYHIATSS